MEMKSLTRSSISCVLPSGHWISQQPSPQLTTPSLKQYPPLLPIFVPQGCYNRIPQTRSFTKKQRFISHSSRGCKSKIKVPAWLLEGPLTGHRRLVMSSHDEKSEGALWGLCYKKTLVPFMMVPPSWLKSLSVDPLLIPLHWALEFQPRYFGGIQTFRPWYFLCHSHLCCLWNH